MSLVMAEGFFYGLGLLRRAKDFDLGASPIGLMDCGAGLGWEIYITNTRKMRFERSPL